VGAGRRDDVDDVGARLAEQLRDVAECRHAELLAEAAGVLHGLIRDSHQRRGLGEAANRESVMAAHLSGADHGDAKRF
jgi:hypothetical protein